MYSGKQLIDGTGKRVSITSLGTFWAGDGLSFKVWYA